MLKAIEDQVAVAVERTRLDADLQNLRVEAEGEKVGTALLNSLSHDLRTPLVSVIGAFLGPSEDLIPTSRAALIEASLDEARRLDRDVQNLDVDPVLIGQALGNILANAAKYAPGGSSIRIGATE